MTREERGLLIRSATDVCAVVVILLLLAGMAARLRVVANGSSNRGKCASNLRQVGQSIQIYANDNKGAFPRTMYSRADDPLPTEYTGINAWEPFGPGGPGPNDVTSGFYLLMRAGDITGGVFTCPSAPDVIRFVPAPGSTEKSYSNFASRENLSYGYTNPYPSAAARNLGFKLNYTLSSDFAIAADMGPGPVVATVPANAPREVMVTANSPNHLGDGQNVLYADVHVDWTTTIFSGSPRPIANAPRDNIYAYGVDASPSVPSAGTHGPPQDQFDSVILPTYDLGYQPGPIPSPMAVTSQRKMLLATVVGMMLLIGTVVVVLLVTVKKKPAPGEPAPQQ
jgi:hypothetical protein